MKEKYLQIIGEIDTLFSRFDDDEREDVYVRLVACSHF